MKNDVKLENDVHEVNDVLDQLENEVKDVKLDQLENEVIVVLDQDVKVVNSEV